MVIKKALDRAADDLFGDAAADARINQHGAGGRHSDWRVILSGAGLSSQPNGQDFGLLRLEGDPRAKGVSQCSGAKHE